MGTCNDVQVWPGIVSPAEPLHRADHVYRLALLAAVGSQLAAYGNTKARRQLVELAHEWYNC